MYEEMSISDIVYFWIIHRFWYFYNMRKILLSILIFICNYAVSQTVIQMNRKGGVSIIPCKVNGIPLSFIFDTGAADVTISLTEASFMFKNGYLTKNDIIGTSNYFDANGDISEGINIILREIDIQGLKLYNVKASIIKNMDAPLLLGQTAISKLGTVQLNLNDNTLTIANKIRVYDFSNNIKKNPASIIRSNENIIGEAIKIGKLLVTEFDFPELMYWSEAKKACISLGKGWRLPTKTELNTLFLNRNKIGGFEGFAALPYWSSTLDGKNFSWDQDLSDGDKDVSHNKYNTNLCRCVK